MTIAQGIGSNINPIRIEITRISLFHTQAVKKYHFGVDGSLALKGRKVYSMTTDHAPLSLFAYETKIKRMFMDLIKLDISFNYGPTQLIVLSDE